MGNLPAKPVAPPLTEHNLPDQTGKVFLVTGATSGIGKELGRLLYGANARVWIAARSKSKAEQTIAEIQSKAPGSKGDLRTLIIDFNDLRTIKPAVEDFLAKEDRLHVLFNNAGIMIPPQGTKTVQGYEAQLGVNNVAPFLFTKLLMPLLTHSAGLAPPGAVRVVWVSSSAVNAFAPATGVEMDNLDYHNDKGQWFKYGASKAGNVFHAAEFARRFSSSGIVNVACDPGNLDTNLYKDMPGYQRFIARTVALKPPVFGAYTELFCGLSTDLDVRDGWAWVVPWGKTGAVRATVGQECKSGGVAAQFWDWSEEQVKQYL
ncbi:hypothetical protein ANO11243_049910 [Dothideomycetidae sp. 11243]|nr:hypothetical protein ANO11243_049910 [fungal sp. No.11243]